MHHARRQLAHVTKAAHPTASSVEVSHVISTATGQAPPPSNAISRTLKDYNPFLTLNRMKAESHALEGCPVKSAIWHIKQPPLGHHGVATPRIVDFDESCFYLDHASRSVAHARPGSTPIELQRHAMDTKRVIRAGHSVPYALAVAGTHRVHLWAHGGAPAPDFSHGDARELSSVHYQRVPPRHHSSKLLGGLCSLRPVRGVRKAKGQRRAWRAISISQPPCSPGASGGQGAPRQGRVKGKWGA